ncbi:MAG: LysM peptidoglycan-binding domain-containing protein [Bacteroidetes bacterium]|nr:MAG: LysM peptidoglycan-binding domain-containing protein [Bacteroidota bacterium]
MKGRNCLWLGLLTACWGQPPASPPKWAHPDSVLRFSEPDTHLPFVQEAQNRLFLAAHLRPVWTLLRDNTRKVRVLHVGDSHLQGEVQGRELRKRLYALWGPGGRGYGFPYAIAGTSSAYDYTSVGRGQWLWARSAHFQPALPLGVTGMAIGTYDPSAEWEVRWAPAWAPAADSGAQLTFLTRTLREGIRLELNFGDSGRALRLDLPAGYGKVSCRVPKPLYTLRGGFRWEGQDSLAYGELHGFFLEEGEKGLTWYSMGVNGARLSDWAQLPLLKESLRLLAPDLVVIDLGTNDLYAAEASLAAFRQALEAAMDTIRAVLPQAAMLVTTPQDFYRRMRPLPSLERAAQLVRWVAARKAVAVWDAHTLLGSMRDWRLAGLSLPDMVHLNPTGYALKGQYFAQAFLRSYVDFLRDSLPDPAQEARDVATLPDSLWRPPPKPVPLTPSLSQFGGAGGAPTYVPARPTYLYHKVRPGETLSHIAQRYGVSVASIRQANGLQGHVIRAGQVLRIPTRGASGGAPAASRPSSASGRYHTVQVGESLWSIAQRYGISMQALCQANGLTLKSAIHPGQRLRIP